MKTCYAVGSLFPGVFEVKKARLAGSMVYGCGATNTLRKENKFHYLPVAYSRLKTHDSIL